MMKIPQLKKCFSPVGSSSQISSKPDETIGVFLISVKEQTPID
jgi:hypothetical protein